MTAPQAAGVGGHRASSCLRSICTGAPSGIPPRCPEVARCYRCEASKPLDQFARDRSKASGRKSICKSCDKAKGKRYYAENGERAKARVNARNAELRGETPGGTRADAAVAPTATANSADFPVYGMGRGAT